MHHDDFTESHSHLSMLYDGASLAARFAYDDRLRHAHTEQMIRAAMATEQSQESSVARLGTALVRWGERLQAAGTAVSPARALDTGV